MVHYWKSPGVVKIRLLLKMVLNACFYKMVMKLKLLAKLVMLIIILVLVNAVVKSCPVYIKKIIPGPSFLRHETLCSSHIKCTNLA